MQTIFKFPVFIYDTSTKCHCCWFAKLCPALCIPMDGSIPSSAVLHYLLEFTQISVHWVNDAIQPFHPLPPPSPFVFLASESFPMGQLFTSGGQNIGASASATVLLMNIQCWFPLGWTGLISLQSKGLTRVFFSTTTQKHQFSSAQPSLWSNSHLCIWLLEKP